MKGTTRGAQGRTTGGVWLRLAILVVALTLLMAGTAYAADYDLYFGDLHSHTDYSDGTGTPLDAYSAAFAAAEDGEIDFFGTTDHNHYGYGPGWMTEENWLDTLAVAESFNRGPLVTLPGYELWFPAIGEMNIIATPNWFQQQINPAGRGFNNGVRGASKVVGQLYDWLVAEGAQAQWNHPALYGAQGGPLVNYFDFAYWTPERDRAINRIEVWNNPDVYEWAYIEALDAGWHVLPSTNSDTHDANWATGYEERTVLLAEENTRAALLEAMEESRGYATQDKNLEIRYTLDGAVMGSTLAPKDEYGATIDVYDPDGARDAIRLIEIVSDGGEVVVTSPEFDSASFTWTATVPSSDERYFWVRVTTASNFWGGPGVTAWTAPVWTGR